MKSRILYEVDPHNRLIIKKNSAPSRLKRFRQVVYGQFRVDNKNSLSYEVTKSSSTDLPQKIKFYGTYSLDKDHDLIFTLNKWNNQCEGNRLRLRTGLIDANGSEIMFLLSSRMGEKEGCIYTITLQGSWQVDENNRLTFGIKKEDDKIDRLTFFTAWRINKNNEIEYNYSKDSPIITLKGHWEIKSKYRISYTLDKRLSSGFDFHSSLGHLIPKGRDTYLAFDIGIDISKTKRIKRKIIFACKWKLAEDKNILLEISPGRKDITLKLTKEILDQQGLVYIESMFKERERYIGGGLTLRW